MNHILFLILLTCLVVNVAFAEEGNSLAKLPTENNISIEESLNLRDPFRRPAKYADPNSDLNVPELQRYSLDQLKLVGIITGPKRAKVLLSTPSNKMFIAQENDRIGNHGGVIRFIKTKAIVVRERSVNIVGKEENIDVELPYLGGVKEAQSETKPAVGMKQGG